MIPGAETVHTRESWQDPRYPVFGPLDNPSDNDTIVIHYTAADDLIDGDPGEHASNLPQYMRNMQRSYVLNRGYSLGYLWAVDWLGGIWQIRGWEYQSAANAGHNGHTWPILVLVDGDDAATPEAIRSIQLIGYEAQRRAGRPQQVKGHGQLKIETGTGTATACPGRGLQTQVNNGTFNPRGPDPVQPPTEGSVMTVNTWWADPPQRVASGVAIGAGQTVGVNLGQKPAAVTVAITVDGDGPGFLTVWSGKQARPNVASLTYAADPNVTSQVDTLVNADGFFQIYSHGSCRVWVDLVATHS